MHKTHKAPKNLKGQTKRDILEAKWKKAEHQGVQKTIRLASKSRPAALPANQSIVLGRQRPRRY